MLIILTIIFNLSKNPITNKSSTFIHQEILKMLMIWEYNMIYVKNGFFKVVILKILLKSNWEKKLNLNKPNINQNMNKKIEIIDLLNNIILNIPHLLDINQNQPNINKNKLIKKRSHTDKNNKQELIIDNKITKIIVNMKRNSINHKRKVSILFNIEYI